MIKVETILNRLTILVVSLEREGGTGVCRYDFTRKKKIVCLDREEEYLDWRQLEEIRIKNPVLLVISGYGVIRKVFRTTELKEIERITGSAEFLFSERKSEEGDRVVAFMRRDRVSDLLQVLQQAKIPVVGVETGTVLIEESFLPDREYDRREIARLWAGWFYDGIKWREFTKGGDKGNALCLLLLGTLKIPLLISLLLLLLVNYLWNDRVRSESADLQAELISLETNSVEQEKLSGEMEKMVADFNQAGENVWVPLLDKIASFVPAEVLLESMYVNPLLKSIAEKKPLTIRQGYIEIAGTTGVPEKVTSFTARLASLTFVREVKLVSLERNPANGLFYFKIWVGL